MVAWLLWLGIHIVWLIGFRNRALVLVNWAWNYISFKRAVRLILPEAKEGVRAVEAMPAPEAAASVGRRREPRTPSDPPR